MKGNLSGTQRHANRAGEKRSDVRVALAQIAPTLGDVAANVARHIDIINEARTGGADLIVFPELSLAGYFLEDLVPDVAVRVDSPHVQTLLKATAGIDAVVGCVLESDDFQFYNAALYLSDGHVHHVHRKLYLPTYGLFDEGRYLAAGERLEAFTAPLSTRSGHPQWRGGILVCEDLWHMSNAVILSHCGVHFYLCPSASPARGVTYGGALGSERSYDAITRTYAQLLTSYVVYCNRVGYEDGVAFWGGSRVVGPDGEVIGEIGGSDETLLWSELDFARLRNARIAYPLLRDERRDIGNDE